MKSADRPRRSPLDRGQILAAAIELAAEDGLDRLSMRSLATRLGVVPMALYKHVAHKEDLLDGMVDVVIASYEPPPPGVGWRASARARILAARGEILARPWLQDAIESRSTRSEAVIRHMDAAAGDFISGGVSVDLTHYAMHALGSRLWGVHSEAFEPRNIPSPDLEPSRTQAAEAMHLMAERYPNVTAIAMDAAVRNPAGACEPEFEFEFGVDLLLDAFERLHEAGWESRAPRSAARG